MTKKDYIKLAQLIRINTADVGTEKRVEVIMKGAFLSRLCVMLEEDNPKFDRDKFLDACDV